jgi:phage terminase large subunit
MNKRVRLLAGGMRASKTISILLDLIDRAQSDKTPTLTSVVSESFPHLRRGAMRDFETILTQHGYWNPKLWNKSEFTYTFETGSKLEFFSADQPGKVRGPSRDRLFVNEANNIPQEAWEQLLYRTREFAYADWNPVGDFYMYTDYQLQDEDQPTSLDDRVDFTILTYQDNEALEAAIVEDIRRKAELNPAWGRVYAQGKRGQMEAKIFKNWRIIDEVPHEARLEVGGGDFGFARDKTAFCDIYYYNGGYIIDEIVSRVGLLDTDLANILNNRPNPNLLYVVDSADAQKVLVLQEKGVNAMGVIKRGSGGDSFTNAAISYVQDQQISLTKRSLNYIKSYRNFMWQTSKTEMGPDGQPKILPKYDHYMSDEMMSVVYAMTNFRPRDEETATADAPDLTSLFVN